MYRFDTESQHTDLSLHGFRILIKYLVILFVSVNSFVGLVWVTKNISFIPLYGDTSEYLELSKSLIVDQYRGVLYPYFLNRSNFLAEATGLSLQHVIYIFQISLTFFSVMLLAFVLLPNTIKTRIRLFVAFITAAVVSLDPLVAHFSLTILTDSLAASFTIIYLSFLILALNEGVEKAGKQALYITISTFFLILMSLMRVDKFYFGLIVFLSFLVIIAFRNKHACSHKMLRLFFSAFCAFVAIATVSLIKSETQIYNQCCLTDFSIAKAVERQGVEVVAA